ncbi:MAG: T9SS type A sorting domain-containing protein, partial [Bacteroidetes bacterium]|nr:T9SS type A sorting domain-containing protein [Bacteroidota bacterium]
SWDNLNGSTISAGAIQYTNMGLILGDPDNAIDDIPFVIYQDAINNQKATVKKFDGTDWLTVGATGLSQGGTAAYTSTAIGLDGKVYVAYKDGTYNNSVTVRQYNSGVWDLIGTAGFSGGSADYVSTAVNPVTGELYVAYKDATTTGVSGKATVQMYAGDGWSPVGITGFSPYIADQTVLAFSSTGTPYIAFADGGNSNKVNVMTFNGTSWVNVGSAGFSTGAVSYLSLKIASDGTPYVVYSDAGNSNKVIAKKYSGGSWVSVGASAGFSSSIANYISFVFAPDGTPLVAYQDGPTSTGKATVQYFNGTNWVPKGPSDFSDGVATYISLSTDNSGNPLVAYADGSVGAKLTLKKLVSGVWSTQGTTGVSAGGIGYVSLAMSNNNAYMSYSDGYAWAQKYGSAEAPLPVNLIDFTAIKQSGTKALLQWKTSSEDNSSYFILESSTDGINFSEIARVNAQGNSNSVVDYSFVQTNPFKGRNYYRLKEVDIDGRLQYFNKIRILDFSSNSLMVISLYPNPAKDRITLQIGGGSSIDQLTIVNINGQVVFQKQQLGNQTKIDLDLSRLNSGTYFLLISSNSERKTMKFIKQ